jgi:hypothetical protein
MDDFITEAETKETAKAILQEAINRLDGKEPVNIWRGSRGINFDALGLAIHTVKSI